MYCNDVLHSELLEILSNLLDESLLAIHQNWTQLESCIFAFYSLAEHVDVTEKKHIPKLMSVIHELPYDKLNDKLLGTALETIGKSGTEDLCPQLSSIKKSNLCVHKFQFISNGIHKFSILSSQILVSCRTIHLDSTIFCSNFTCKMDPTICRFFENSCFCTTDSTLYPQSRTFFFQKNHLGSTYSKLIST